MKSGMVKINVFFPGGEDIFFDMHYYKNKHLPKVQKLLGDAVKEVTVERGISGGAPGSFPPYAAVACLYFETLETFEESFGSKAAGVMAEASAFTNSKAFIQISEVIL